MAVLKSFVIVLLFCCVTQITIAQDCNVKVPNTVSNSSMDGLEVKTDCKYSSFSLAIFNRWGKTVFETDDIDAHWDPDGNEAGTYFWVVKLEFENGEERDWTGHVSYLK